MIEYDFSVTGDRRGEQLLLHKTDCPLVQKHRENGQFVGTLYGCREIPDIERCECLDNVAIARSAAG